MCVSKRKGMWRSARRALAVGALSVVTFAGHHELEGDAVAAAELPTEGKAPSEIDLLLRQALALDPSEAQALGKRGIWIPLTDLERVSRALSW